MTLLLTLGLVGIPIWCYSNFDPTRWALDGHYYAVVAIVRIDPDIVNRRDEEGFTLLYAAASGAHPEIVEFLLAAGADPNKGCHFDQSTILPVLGAESGGSARVMKSLIEAGADINLIEELGDEPLILKAARDGHAAVVRVLLDAGADPNDVYWHRDPEPRQGLNALESAAIWGHVDVIKVLLEGGATVEFLDDGSKRTALHTFCRMPMDRSDGDDFYEHWLRNMPAIVDVFVEELGDVNYREDSVTPLHAATGPFARDNGEIVRYLVENYPDLDVNAKDFEGYTPLHEAMAHSFPAVKYLVDNCPDLDVNATGNLEYTPLHKGARFANVKAVKYLLENCPTLNVNATDESGMTPLNEAGRALEGAKSAKRQKQIEALTEIIRLIKAHGGEYGLNGI